MGQPKNIYYNAEENVFVLNDNYIKKIILNRSTILSVLLQSGLIINGDHLKIKSEGNRLLIKIEDDKKVDKYYTYFKLNINPKRPYEFVGGYYFESYEKAYISFKQDSSESNRYVLLLKDDNFEISWYYTLVNGNFTIDRPVYRDLENQSIGLAKKIKD